MAGSWPDKDKLPRPPWDRLRTGVAVPGAGGHVLGHLAKFCCDRDCSPLYLKSLAMRIICLSCHALCSFGCCFQAKLAAEEGFLDPGLRALLSRNGSPCWSTAVASSLVPAAGWGVLFHPEDGHPLEIWA